MYRKEIEKLETKIDKLKLKQEALEEAMTWEEACEYMQGVVKPEIRNANGFRYQGYVGIGLLYTEHTIRGSKDTGYWKI